MNDIEQNEDSRIPYKTGRHSGGSFISLHLPVVALCMTKNGHHGRLGIMQQLQITQENLWFIVRGVHILRHTIFWKGGCHI